MIIVILFSIATLFVGGQEDFLNRCSDYNFIFGNHLDDFHVVTFPDVSPSHGKTLITNCNRSNNRNFTYTLKARHNGEVKNVENFGCTSIHYNNTNAVYYYCAVPVDRACEKVYCYGDYCPIYTEGSDRNSAKCPEDKWVIDHEEYTVKPVCKNGPYNPVFHAVLQNGTEIVMSNAQMNVFVCKLNTRPLPKKSTPDHWLLPLIFAGVFGGVVLLYVCSWLYDKGCDLLRNRAMQQQLRQEEQQEQPNQPCSPPANQPDPTGNKTIIPLLFCISTLFVCSQGGFPDHYCSDDDFNFETSLDNFHVRYILAHYRQDCTQFNKGNLTYTLKVHHNGELKNVDKFGCNEDHNMFSQIYSYYYQVKGEPKTKYSNKYDVQYYCVVPIDRACENLFDYPFKYNNPKFIKGTDSKAAQLECPDDNWIIEKNEYALKPVCKDGPNKNEAAFYAFLKHGKEVLLKNPGSHCKYDTTKNPFTRSDDGWNVAFIIAATFGGCVALFVCLFIFFFCCYTIRDRIIQRRIDREPDYPSFDSPAFCPPPPAYQPYPIGSKAVINPAVPDIQT